MKLQNQFASKIALTIEIFWIFYFLVEKDLYKYAFESVLVIPWIIIVCNNLIWFDFYKKRQNFITILAIIIGIANVLWWLAIIFSGMLVAH